MNGEGVKPYRFWQVMVIVGMAIVMCKMILDLDGIRKEAVGVAADTRPIFNLARDVRSDIGESTLYVTHDRIFEIHRVGGEIAKYYGVPGSLLRETDSGSTSYALLSGTIQLGMDHGMIIAKLSWRDRFYVFGAPPGWAMSPGEMLRP